MNEDKPENLKTILICDDNLLNRKLITAFLHDPLYRIIEIETGQECIKTVVSSQVQIDMILLDIGLKDISGVEVCQTIRACDKPYLQKLPIIAYTAHAMEDDCKEYLANGFTDVLIKPITNNDLLRILEKHLA